MLFDQARLDQTPLVHLPPVTRARGFRLYCANGKRYVDLWQAGGAAILGHNPPGVLRELKNTAERGLFAPLPNHLEARLLKALAALLPGYSFHLYADTHSLCRALGGGGVDGSPVRAIFDPALGDSHNEGREKKVSLWRPFLPEEDAPSSPLLLPVLPWHLAPKTLAVKSGAPSAERAAIEAMRPPASDAISPVVLAAAARAVYDLAAEIGAERAEPAEARFPALAKALASSEWRRKGPYIHWGGRMDEGGYPALFRRFLEAGFLPPPAPEQPAILPRVLSAGEEAKLAALLAR